MDRKRSCNVESADVNGSVESKTASVFILVLAVSLFCCKSALKEKAAGEAAVIFERASENATLAQEGFVRCNSYLNAWLSYADPTSKLVPRTLDRDRDIWNANDCAADNFPFLVLTSYFTDSEKYQGRMKEMLDNEIRLTSRIRSLPDTYSFSKKGFQHDLVSMPRIVFGTTEYMKDGLLPVTEWLGASPWSDRMLTMLRDLDEYVDVAGQFGEGAFGNAPEAEVNGELLQILSRMYWFSGDRRFLEWAIQIGDHFLLHEGYPLTSFNYLRLRDHGCELVAGLCELYVTLHFTDPKRKQDYQKPLYHLLDYILEHGRNEDGLFYNAIHPKTGKVVDSNLADTWGYTLNGYYSIFMIDSVEAYKDAVTRIFENLHKYHQYNWENKGADGYADAIEGALNLYNRMPDERAARWIDAEIKVMWSMQDSSHRENAQQWKNSGIIEGWYGDGNFARTTLMYNLWKSKGLQLQPWRPEVSLGAEVKDDTLYISIGSAVAYTGKLIFDKRRHKLQMNMPLDWPRINQFPEWFTASPQTTYRLLNISKGTSIKINAHSIMNGLDVVLQPHETKRLMVITSH